MEDKLDLILHELQGMKVEFRTELNRQGEMIVQLIGIVKATNEKLSNFKLETEANFKLIRADVSNLKDDVSVLKEDVSMLKKDVSVLKEDVTVLKEDVSILKKDVRTLIDGQVRHDKVLESLAIRSLEQETEIRELKRA